MVSRIISNMLGKKTALPASGGALMLDPVRRDSQGNDSFKLPSRRNAKAITQFIQQAMSQYGHTTVLMEGVLEIKVANIVFLATLESNSRVLRLLRKYNSEHIDLDEMRHRAQNCNVNFRFVRTTFYHEPLTLFSDYEFFFDHERHPEQLHQVFRIFVAITNEIDKTLHYAA